MTKNIQEFVVNKVIDHIEEQNNDKEELIRVINEMMELCPNKFTKRNCLAKDCDAFIILISPFYIKYKTEQNLECCRYCHIKDGYCSKHKEEYLKIDELDSKHYLCKNEDDCYVICYQKERNKKRKITHL